MSARSAYYKTVEFPESCCAILVGTVEVYCLGCLACVSVNLNSRDFLPMGCNL